MDSGKKTFMQITTFVITEVVEFPFLSFLPNFGKYKHMINNHFLLTTHVVCPIS